VSTTQEAILALLAANLVVSAALLMRLGRLEEKVDRALKRRPRRPARPHPPSGS
jgi:hypothetical protein